MGALTMILPLAGVGLIALLCWLAGGTVDAVIGGEDAVRAQLGLDEPDFDAGRVLLGQDRRAALAAARTGEDIAAVMAFGDKLVTRRLGRGAVRAATVRERDGGRVLSIVTTDPTCRRIDVALAAGSSDDRTNARSGSRSGAPADDPSGDPRFWLAAVERLARAPRARGGSRRHPQEA